MSATNLSSLNNNKSAQEPTARGAGPAGTTAVITAQVTKDQNIAHSSSNYTIHA